MQTKTKGDLKVDIKLDLENILSLKTFKKSFMVTWFYIMIGILLLAIMLVIADQTKNGSQIFYFLNNAGLVLLYISILIAYSGVHKINLLPSDDATPVKNLFVETGKKSYYIVAISLGILIVISGLVSLQLLISFISNVYLLGPIIMVLLTIPLFVLNISCLVIAIYLLIITPPMVGEDKNFKTIFNTSVKVIREKGLYIILYSIISIVIFFLCLKAVYYITGYAGSITKAIHWKFNITYPVIVENFVVDSYIAELLRKIGPKPSTMEMLRKSNFELLDYLHIIKYTITFFYYLTVSFIFTLPFAVFFTFLSNFYKKIRE